MLVSSMKYTSLENLYLLECLSIVTVVPQVRSRLMSPQIKEVVGITLDEIVK